jgi:hypothetical protein
MMTISDDVGNKTHITFHWENLNTELHSEALAIGLNSESKDSFRSNGRTGIINAERTKPSFTKHCFTFSNEGVCKDTICKYGHFCQICKGNYAKKYCTKKPQFLIEHSVENLQVAGNKANPQHIKNYRLANEFEIVTPIKPDIFKQYLVGYDPHKTELHDHLLKILEFPLLVSFLRLTLGNTGLFMTCNRLMDNL